jgi:hypothetical protein
MQITVKLMFSLKFILENQILNHLKHACIKLSIMTILLMTYVIMYTQRAMSTMVNITLNARVHNTKQNIMNPEVHHQALALVQALDLVQVLALTMMLILEWAISLVHQLHPVLLMKIMKTMIMIMIMIMITKKTGTMTMTMSPARGTNSVPLKVETACVEETSIMVPMSMKISTGNKTGLLWLVMRVA